MQATTLKILLSGAAILAPMQAAMAQDAAAPEAPAAQAETYPGEILVTAQRREERVQDIPVAITAFGGQQVEKPGIMGLETLAPRVASFYFGSFGAARPQLYIRGIGTRSFAPGSDSTVRSEEHTSEIQSL